MREKSAAGETAGIAGITGHYREHLPPPGLQAQFQCLWSSALADGQAGDIAVMPDGCVDVVWRADRLLVVGPDIVAAHPDLAPGARVMGARFQPGAARGWLGLPMSEIVGREVALADLLGVRGRDFAHRMEDARTPGARAQVFQAQLIAASGNLPGADRSARETFHLAARGLGAQRMRERLNISQRSLLRHSRDHFGYGPKTLERILRLQRFLDLARADHSAGPALLAVDAGYADQSHLAREVRAFCGMTATALLAQIRS